MSRMGRDVDLAPGPSADGTDAASVHGYLARPISGAGPGVVVVQEAWGLVDHICDVSDRLAREGFVAFAPDLYHGAGASDVDADEPLAMDRDLTRAGEVLDAAVVSLLNQDETRGARVGCVGFCTGGQLALVAAARSERIGAVVDCYGTHPDVALDLAGMRATVLGIFAENDDLVAPEAVQALEALLRDAGVRAEIKVHIGVGNAFLNESRPDAYDAPSAREAWSDILSFLRAELV